MFKSIEFQLCRYIAIINLNFTLFWLFYYINMARLCGLDPTVRLLLKTYYPFYAGRFNDSVITIKNKF